jgi:nucleotide-binding universal stress UspA family protein
MGVPVELLRVNNLTQLPPHAPPLEGGEYLKKVAASFAGITDVVYRVELGDPAGTIIDLAAAQPSSLIAMATHGYSGARRWLLGSVAEKVLHAARNDLLVVRPGDGVTSGESRLKTVLVPLDGSALAEKVLPIVTELGIRLNLAVVLICVFVRVYFGPPEALLPVFGAHVPNPNELWAQARSEANNYMIAKVEQLRAEGLAHVSSLLIDGSGEGAAAAIIELARQTEENLVVMSTHGRSGIGRWLIGSVTERVVRHSSGPVLVIRPQF